MTQLDAPSPGAARRWPRGRRPPLSRTAPPRSPVSAGGGRPIGIRRSDYIVGPAYDWLLFLLPPLLSLGIGIAVADTPLTEDEFELWGDDKTLAGLFMGTLIHAHLFAVFFRSHANSQIFSLYPQRFIAAPILLFTAMMTSQWMLVGISVLVTFWDVYHSGLQTFGFARIYDRKAGNPPELGRRLDLWMNHLLYAGPIVGGHTMMVHFDDFENFEDLGTTLFNYVPFWMEGHQRYLTWALLICGTLFTIYYVLAHLRFHRQGHRISALKVFLIASTGLCSVYTWGLNSWGEAFLIMNLFHAVQYFALVWAMERDHLAGRIPARSLPLARIAALAALVLISGAYGLWTEWVDTGVDALWAITLVVSTIHFWYDGFIWSVRKRQV